MTTESIDQQVLTWMEDLSNWGRWGPDDEAGTLNLITPDCRRRAAALVTDGSVVSCAHDIRPEGSTQRYMIGTGLDRQEGGPGADRIGASDGGRSAAAFEFLGFAYHGMTITHLDAPSHVFWRGQMYNGASASLVNDRHGATRSDVRVAADTIVTRGVLVDVPWLLGVESMEPSEPVLPEHLDAATEAAGVRVEPGDALLVRTGEAARRRTAKGYSGVSQPGIHASCMPWLRTHDVALLASDVAQEVRPTGIEGFSMPVHTIGLVAMGLWLVDNCDLDELAAKCARLSRWEFQFVLAPLRFRGATGGPANPLAVF